MVWAGGATTAGGGWCGVGGTKTSCIGGGATVTGWVMAGGIGRLAGERGAFMTCTPMTAGMTSPTIATEVTPHFLMRAARPSPGGLVVLDAPDDVVAGVTAVAAFACVERVDIGVSLGRRLATLGIVITPGAIRAQ
jgi:hypothetical protein